MDRVAPNGSCARECEITLIFSSDCTIWRDWGWSSVAACHDAAPSSQLRFFFVGSSDHFAATWISAQLPGNHASQLPPTKPNQFATGTDTHGLKAFRCSALLDTVRACSVDKDVFASDFVIRADRGGVKTREIPVRVIEKRPPSINLFKRVPNVLKNVAKLTYAIRIRG